MNVEIAEKTLLDKNHLIETEKHLCRDSLKYLCETILGMRDWDRVHDDVEEFGYKNRHSRFKLFLLPRGHLKTSILSVGKTIQDILKDFNTSVLLTSAVWGNSRSFLSEIKEYLTTKSRLPFLFKEFVSDKWNQDEIIVKQRTKADKTPTIDTAGIDKVLTSQHYKVIRADDLVTRENITNREQIEKVKNHFKDLIKLLEPDGHMEIIGTRWHDSDLYGHIIKELTKVEMKADAFCFLRREAVENGQVIFPKKFSLETLENIKRQIGSYEFSSNYNNNPVNPDNQQFKPPIRYWTDLGDDHVHYVSVDLAISEKTSADYTVVMDGAITRSNQLCVVEYCRKRMTPMETIEKIFEYVLKYKVKKVGIESIAYQRALVTILEDEMRKRNIFFEAIPLIYGTDKFTRVMALQPRYESGNLLLKQGMIELEDEMARFPVGEHDDCLDALANILRIAQPQYLHRPKVYLPKGGRYD